MLAPHNVGRRPSAKGPWAGLRAVLYLRCSDPSQDKSVDNQRDVLTEWARCHHIRIVGEFAEEGVSGDASRRPQFSRMLSLASSGNFDAILCWDQDRFSRNDTLKFAHFAFQFREAGIRLITYADGEIDWNSSTGRIISAIKTEANHEYLLKISRTVLRAFHAGAKHGSWIGKPPYAGRIVGTKQNKRLVFDDIDRVVVVKRIFDECVDQRRSFSDIAARLEADGIPAPNVNVKYRTRRELRWRFQAVQNILRNEAYIGTVRFNRFSRSKYYHLENGMPVEGGKSGWNDATDQIVHENQHEAIIDLATFRKAQTILDRRGKAFTSRYSPDDNPYQLHEKLRCGICNSPMRGKMIRNRRCFICGNHQDNGDEACPGMMVREDEALAMLAARLHTVFDRICEPEAEEMLELARKAAKGVPITADDLPQVFLHFKRLFDLETRSLKNPELIRQQIESKEDKINRARRNLAFLESRDSVRAVEGEIRRLETQRDELKHKLKSLPTEDDLNRTVLKVLWRLADVAQHKPTDLKRIIGDVNEMVCHSDVRGSGTGRRYKLKNVVIRFDVGITNETSLTGRHP
jgi:DNA invertase Pin-like site-specific DNA recombinase